jgi:NAD(P)-dependent dehydrogenase (short-subunit alcohol dehydrogenase family)
VAEEIRAKGGTAVADHHTVDDGLAGEAMVETALRAFGKLDILVNNAGIVDDMPFTEMPLSKMREVMEINFWGSLFPTRAALPHMMKAGYGRIVFSSSQAGLYGQKEASLYAASKAALIGLARTLGREIGDEADVCVNVITPAAYTPMSMKVLPPEWEDYMSPFKVAPVVGWLSSEDCKASGMVFNAGAGRVRRARIIEGPAVRIEDDDMNGCFPEVDTIPNPEEAASSFHSGKELMPELFAADRDLTEKA